VICPALFRANQAYIVDVDVKRDQLETRVATLELMLVAKRAQPKPREDEIAKLEQDLKAAKAALEKYNREHPEK
jgi:peptidoglycan hydrolase CwlO-like protein